MEKKNNDDKPKIAVALEYTPGEQAPKILATGRGYMMFLYMQILSLLILYQNLK